MKTPCKVLEWGMATSGSGDRASVHRSILYQYEYGGKTRTSRNYEVAADREPDLRDFEEEGVRAMKGPAFCHVDPARPSVASFHGARMGRPWALVIGGLAMALAAFVFLVLTFLPKRRKHTPEEAQWIFFRKVTLLIGGAVMAGALLLAINYRAPDLILGQIMRAKLVQVPAVIEAGGVGSVKGSGRKSHMTYHYARVVFSYDLAGRKWHADRWNHDAVAINGGSAEQTAKLLADYPHGRAVTAWVHPEKPWIAVLDPGLRWSSLRLILPAGLLALGFHIIRSGFRRNNA